MTGHRITNVRFTTLVIIYPYNLAVRQIKTTEAKHDLLDRGDYFKRHSLTAQSFIQMLTAQCTYWYRLLVKVFQAKVVIFQ